MKRFLSCVMACVLSVCLVTQVFAIGETDKITKKLPLRPLLVDTSSYFWMRKESGLQVAQTFDTQDIFNITADSNSCFIKLISGTGFERLSSDNIMWAGVIEYDDGSCKPCIVTAVDVKNRTMSVYPKTENKIENGRFTALLSDSQHLTELGYNALMQYVYSANPKYCDKTLALDRYAPTSTEEMNTPYSRLPGTPAIYNGKRNDYSAWSMSQSVYGTFLIPYADYLTKGEYGFEREIELDGRNGFYETYIGTVYYPGVTDVTKIEKDKGYELHIEWYVDDVLVSSQLKKTNYAERFCFDFPAGYESAKIKVYYTQMRKNSDDTISIGDSTVWISTGDYGDKLIANDSSVVQMFDSWGAFWSRGETVAENGEVYFQGASGREMSRLLAQDGSTLLNRSKAGMTSRYGRAWFDKTIVEKQPDYVLLNYGINDYHSFTGSSFPNEVDPQGNTIDMVAPMSTEEFAENMYMIFSEATTAGITPIYVTGVIAQNPSWVTSFINNVTDMCKTPPFMIIGKGNTTVDVKRKLVFTSDLLVKDTTKLLVYPVGTTVTTDKSGFLGTGTQISVRNFSLSEFHLISEGDIDGDGVCDVIDAALAMLMSTGLKQPTTYQIYAANGCVSDEFDATSYQNVVNVCLSA